MKRDLKSSTFRAIAILLLLAAAVLFCMALADEAIITSEQPIKGFWILLTGWMGFIIFQFSWYANPLALMSVLLMRRRPVWSLLASGIALLLVAQAFLFDEIPTVKPDEPIMVLARGTGFYLWIASIISLFYACIFMVIYRRFTRVGLKEYETDTDRAILSPYPAAAKTAQPAKQTKQPTTLSYPRSAISTSSNP